MAALCIMQSFVLLTDLFYLSQDIANADDVLN